VLTAREGQVLKPIAEVHLSRAIARMLILSPKTVEYHRANILQKLEIRDRPELTGYASKAGLIQP
jgi:DNA-binding NarL/FixJ family response regulator